MYNEKKNKEKNYIFPYLSTDTMLTESIVLMICNSEMGDILITDLIVYAGQYIVEFLSISTLSNNPNEHLFPGWSCMLRPQVHGAGGLVKSVCRSWSGGKQLKKKGMGKEIDTRLGLMTSAGREGNFTCLRDGVRDPRNERYAIQEKTMSHLSSL